MKESEGTVPLQLERLGSLPVQRASLGAQGLSDVAEAGSKSVEELVTEGQSLEGEVSSGIEDCAGHRITERRVSERLKLAHREYARVAADRDAIIAQVRTGRPANEAPRVEQAAHAGRLAYENDRQALEDFAHFVLRGTGLSQEGREPC